MTVNSNALTNFAPADEVRLSDGRRARVQGYNPERTRFVAEFMTRTGFPPVFSPAVVLVHGALLALAAVETIDGEPLAWPEPTFAGVDGLVHTVLGADLEMLAQRYARSLPLGVQIRPFWKVAADVQARTVAAPMAQPKEQ